MSKSEKRATTPVAERLAGAANGFPAGAVYLWGYTPTKPDDSSFLLHRVEGAEPDDRLDLYFENTPGLTGPLEAGILSIWKPRGVCVTESAITISAASRARWTDIDVAPISEEEVQIRQGADVTLRRSAPEAVVLRLLMGRGRWGKTLTL